MATLGKGCNEEGGADLDLFALVLSESDVNLTQECLQGSSDTSCDTLVEFIEYNMTATVVDFCTKLDIATLQTELEFYLDGQAMESDIYCADGKNPAKAPITGAMLADFTTCLDVTSRCSEVTAPLPDLSMSILKTKKWKVMTEPKETHFFWSEAFLKEPNSVHTNFFLL